MFRSSNESYAFNYSKRLKNSGQTEPRDDSFYDMIADSEIGKDETMFGPFGQRKLIFCDYTTTSRSLDFIEDFIRHEILEKHGSAHTLVLRNEARFV